MTVREQFIVGIDLGGTNIAVAAYARNATPAQATAARAVDDAAAWANRRATSEAAPKRATA